MLKEISAVYRLYKRNPTKVKKLLELFYYSDRYNGSEFSIDFNAGTIKADGIEFGIVDMDPWILIETFGLKIHDRINAKKGMTILDAGACFGDTALHFSKIGCTVYAIEPDPANFSAMNRNVKLNPGISKGVVQHQLALGNDEMLDFAYNAGNNVHGSASAFFGKGKTIQIQSYSLGRLLDKLELKSVDILKMDCKGAENYLDSNDLRRVTYCAKIEYTNDDRSGETLRRLIAVLKAAGLDPGKPYKHDLSNRDPIEVHGTLLAFRE